MARIGARLLSLLKHDVTCLRLCEHFWGYGRCNRNARRVLGRHAQCEECMCEGGLLNSNEYIDRKLHETGIIEYTD